MRLLWHRESLITQALAAADAASAGKSIEGGVAAPLPGLAWRLRQDRQLAAVGRETVNVN